MRKYLITSLLIATVTSFLFSSCEKTDTTSYMPTWKGFNVSPRPAVPGDSVTVTACQDQIGHLLYKAIYNWTVTYHLKNSIGADSVVVDTYSNSVIYDYDPADPSIRFLVPVGVTRDINVSFEGRYMYSGQGYSANDGSTIQSGTSGMLHRSQSSPTEGQSVGSVTVPIQ